MALAKYYEDLLERQSASLERMQGSLNRDVNSNNVQKLRNELRGNLQVMQDLVVEFMDLITDPDNKQIVELKNEVKRLQGMRDMLNYQSHESLRGERDALKSRLEMELAKIQQLEEANQQYQDRQKADNRHAMKLSAAINAKEHQISRLKATQQELECRLNQQKSECEYLQQALLLARQELKGLNEKEKLFSNYEKDVQQKDEEIAMLYEEVDRLEKLKEMFRNPKDLKEISTLRKQNSNLTAKLGSLQLEFERENKKLIKENYEYYLQTAKYEEVLKEKSCIIEQKSKDNQNHKVHINNLKNEINQLKNKLVQTKQALEIERSETARVTKHLQQKISNLKLKKQKINTAELVHKSSKPKVVTTVINGDVFVKDMDAIYAKITPKPKRR